MKFCENCGTQLDDNAVFCEECGAKQEVVQQAQPEVATSEVEATVQAPKLSATCTPAKKEMKDWIVILILVLCSSLIIGTGFISTILQFVALVIMWRKRSWSFGVKIGVTIAYIILYLI